MLTITQRAGRKEWTALAALMLPVLLVAVDNTVLSFALPAISLEFNTSGTTLLWIIDIYPLVLAGLLVAMGSLGDRFGRRRMLITGAVGFAVFSALAAFAPSAEVLVAARAGLGVFGAMLMPATLSLIRNIFTDRGQRRLAIAVWAAGFSAGAALGPILGGLLLEHFWWGSVFLLAVPVLVLMLILTPLFVPESKDPAPGAVDIWSIFLSIATMLPVVYAIKNLANGGNLMATLAVAALGVTAGWLFTRRQLRRSQPMLDVRLFTVMPFTGAVLVNLLAVFSLVGFLYFVSQHLQLVLGLSPLDAGLVLLPGLAITIAAGLLVVPLVRRIRPHPVGRRAAALRDGLLDGCRNPRRFGRKPHAGLCGTWRRSGSFGDALQRPDPLQCPGGQGRCGVGGFRNGLRSGLGLRHRGTRQHPGGGLPAEHRPAREPHGVATGNRERDIGRRHQHCRRTSRQNGGPAPGVGFPRL